MSKEDNPTSIMTPEERSKSINFLRHDALSLACQSGDEQKVRSILSKNDYTACFKSSMGYALLCATLLSLRRKLKDPESMISENDKSKFIIICKILLEREENVNDETFLEFQTTPLHLAVEIESEEIVKLLLAKGADVNIRKDELSPLHFAVSINSTHMVQLLIENGADPGNCHNCCEYMSPLSIAVANENKKIVEMLLAKETVIDPKNHNLPLQIDLFKYFRDISRLFLENLDNPDNSNNARIGEDFVAGKISPLHIATVKKNKEIIAQLIAKGIDVNGKDSDWNTALHYAVLKDFKNIAQLLLENGADLDICNKQGKKPFDYCKSVSMKNFYSQYRIKVYLDNGGSIEEKDDAGYTLLHHAVKYISMDAISLLLDRGCNVNAVSNLGESPLHLAVKIGNKEIILLLLQKKCDINATTNTGCTSLHLVADLDYYKSFDIFKILIENGANVKLKNKFGLTALNYAVRRQSPKKAQVLLGENPDTSDKELKMAFCLSFFDHENKYDLCKEYFDKDRCLCEVFFDFGFTIHVDDFQDMYIPTELYSDWLSETADENYTRSIMQNFLKKHATSDTESISKLFFECQVLVGAARHGFVEIFFNLLKPNMNVNVRFQDGNTLLHYASKGENVTIIKELLRRDAAVNARNDKCETPLHFSIFRGCIQVIKVLLENGADVDARNTENDTPLLLELSQDPDFDNIRLLLEFGADVNCIAHENCPLRLALDYCNPNIAKLLLHYGAYFNPSNLFEIIPPYIVLKYFEDDIFEDHLELIDLVFNYGAKVIDLHPDMFFDPNDCAKYKVKSLAANLENFGFSVDCSEIAEFQSKCLEEVGRMKAMKITGCSISMYDLLIKSQRQMAVYMRNANVVKMLESIDFEETFPIYAKKLNICVMRGKLENRLLELCYECLDVILKVNLPHVIIDRLVSYFSTSDLHRLIIASPIAREKKATVKYPFIIESLD